MNQILDSTFNLVGIQTVQTQSGVGVLAFALACFCCLGVVAAVALAGHEQTLDSPYDFDEVEETPDGSWQGISLSVNT